MTPPVRRLVLVGDVHDHGPRLRASLHLVSGDAVDLAVLVGDVGEDPPWEEPARRIERQGHDTSLRRVISMVRRTLDCPVAFVPGNHDLPDPPADLQAVNLDDRMEDVAGVRIVGLGGAGPARFGFPYEWSEAEAEARLRAAVPEPRTSRVDVFVSHAPPERCRLDRTARGEHVGSRAVREAMERLRPRLFVCGHIHEAWGFERVDGIPCVNAGAMGEPYGRVIAWTVDWRQEPQRIRSFTLDPTGVPRVETPLP